MQKSLLAHIASNFISEYENVANSSISYLLNQYPACRKALETILNIEHIPSYYATELSTNSNGRPDVTGLDSNGVKTIIIEGKFWANLTENQPVNYLKELSDNGKILFLAPDKRLSSLRIEIDKRAEGATDRIVVNSWREFIAIAEKENNKNHNSHLASDLYQLSELCRKMDEEGMPPLSASDLDPMNGRIAKNFADIIDECNHVLRKWEHSDFKGLKTTPSKYGHGFYFRGYDFGCSLRFDVNMWFSMENHTPIWLSISDDKWKNSEKINHYLNDYDPVNSFDSDYGMQLVPGMDKNQVIKHIIKNVKDVLGVMHMKMQNEI